MDAVGSTVGIGGGWMRRRSVVGSLVVAVVAVVVAVAALVAMMGARGGEAAGRSADRAAALAAIGGAAGTVDGGARAQLQMVPGERPTVVVNGVGEASAPAESAVVQLIVRGTGGFGPEGEKPVSESEAPVPVPPGQPPALTDEDLAPIVAAIVAAGVDEADVAATPSSPFAGPFGPGSAQVVATLGAEQLASIADIVAAATEAAQGSDAGLFVEFVGVGYTVADCATLERDARQDAADDARARGEGLAEVLGLTAGDVLLASEGGYYGPDSGLASGCAEDPLEGLSGGKGYSLPPFDPNAEAEVEIYANLSVAYAVE